MRTGFNCARIRSEGGGSCDGGGELSGSIRRNFNNWHVWNVLRHDHRTSWMGAFMLPSQPLAKFQHDIDIFPTFVRNNHENSAPHRLTNEVASKITGQLFVPTLWKFEDDGSLPAERAPLHCQWIQINFQQLTHIERCRKLERENDSTAARCLHINKTTCNYIQILQLSSPPPIPTDEGTPKYWTRRWRENLIILLCQLDPGCERRNTAVGTLVRSFTWGFSVYFCRLRDRPLIKYIGLWTFMFTSFIIINTMICSEYCW